MLQTLSVNHLPAHERFDVFGDMVNQTFFPMGCTPARQSCSFEGEIHTQQLNQLGLAVVTSSAIQAYRRQSHIGYASDAMYLVKIQMEGQGRVRQRGQEAYLEPGDFVLCSSCEPYELHFPDHYRQLVISLPQPVLDEYVQHPQQYLGRRMEASVGANGLFTGFVASIGARLESLSPQLIQRLEANVVDLLTTSLSHLDNLPATQEALGCKREEHLCRIKGFIRNHLHDERLSPSWIADHLGISTRYLHMLFEDQGESVSRCIWRTRLYACRAALADPERQQWSVSEIAYQFGFSDASHFSRMFKGQFGEAPARYRKDCRRHIDIQS